MSILKASGEPYSALSAAFLMAQGNTRALDIFTIVQDNKRPTFGFLSFSWAVISDIDLESEQWRCCGGFRFTYACHSYHMMH
jgi:sphingosine kinase